jgi:hypothetical protein
MSYLIAAPDTLAAAAADVTGIGSSLRAAHAAAVVAGPAATAVTPTHLS